MTQTSGSSRRALRDLVPATLATGAAGLVVALVVGGTTAAVRSVVAPDGRTAGPAIAELAGDVVTSGAAAARDVTVRVQPARPPAIGVVAAFDLAPPTASPLAVASAKPAVPASASRAPVVTPATSVLSSPVLASPVVAAATTPAAPLVATVPERGRAKGPKGAKAATSSPSSTVSLASTGRVALDGATSDDGDDGEGGEDGKARHRGNGPPDHAPAKGYRNR